MPPAYGLGHTGLPRLVDAADARRTRLARRAQPRPAQPRGSRARGPGRAGAPGGADAASLGAGRRASKRPTSASARPSSLRPPARALLRASTSTAAAGDRVLTADRGRPAGPGARGLRVPPAPRPSSRTPRPGRRPVAGLPPAGAPAAATDPTAPGGGTIGAAQGGLLTSIDAAPGQALSAAPPGPPPGAAVSLRRSSAGVAGAVETIAAEPPGPTRSSSPSSTRSWHSASGAGEASRRPTWARPRRCRGPARERLRPTPLPGRRGPRGRVRPERRDLEPDARTATPRRS